MVLSVQCQKTVLSEENLPDRKRRELIFRDSRFAYHLALNELLIKLLELHGVDTTVFQELLEHPTQSTGTDKIVDWFDTLNQIV